MSKLSSKQIQQVVTLATKPARESLALHLDSSRFELNYRNALTKAGVDPDNVDSEDLKIIMQAMLDCLNQAITYIMLYPKELQDVR